VHLNLHKTFSTPHGSGGPGAGVVGVKDYLVDFLPVPIIDKEKDYYYFNYHLKHSIGKVRSFFGNFGVLIRAYAYILQLGREGLKEVAQNAVINANYIRQSLKSVYDIASPKACMHEVVLSCSKQKRGGISAFDIAKRLIDYGIHPPTMYFPLIVKEALMVEPPETEGKETLDYFIQTMKLINEEVQREPQLLKDAPITTPVKRLDEVSAARFPVVRWQEHGD
jgi:glycine dehydrogenase subunit 2